ncbi:hypothetical protein BDP27DRAFT_1366107 [Rhodocollybia butyracea]|uniref:Uncharacterized protein n=1 Tax=Rhodocollybia butyracea TaxID=206335 RepID=A0A9P5PI62_9AGAR|nr:hypothetical protein BDP27DRAFT_1366107 [Rhodocollybia butyracea]
MSMDVCERLRGPGKPGSSEFIKENLLRNLKKYSGFWLTRSLRRFCSIHAYLLTLETKGFSLDQIMLESSAIEDILSGLTVSSPQTSSGYGVPYAGIYANFLIPETNSLSLKPEDAGNYPCPVYSQACTSTVNVDGPLAGIVFLPI